jgi:hypothetical protein
MQEGRDRGRNGLRGGLKDEGEKGLEEDAGGTGKRKGLRNGAG